MHDDGAGSPTNHASHWRSRQQPRTRRAHAAKTGCSVPGCLWLRPDARRVQCAVEARKPCAMRQQTVLLLTVARAHQRTNATKRTSRLPKHGVWLHFCDSGRIGANRHHCAPSASIGAARATTRHNERGWGATVRGDNIRCRSYHVRAGCTVACMLVLAISCDTDSWVRIGAREQAGWPRPRLVLARPPAMEPRGGRGTPGRTRLAPVLSADPS